MRRWRFMTLATLAVAVSACYRQVVQTGRTPGPTVMHRPWTPVLLWGLVPAPPVDISQDCRNGIATVETQVTAANLLVTVVTLGIYAPRDVKVTCAVSSAARRAGTAEVGR